MPEASQKVEEGVAQYLSESAQGAELLLQNLDLWTAATRKKSTSGRGAGGKIELAGIKKLRELILELAVRGKLVPQDPNDEPAAALLTRIEERRSQSRQSLKSMVAKKLPAIVIEEQPFDIPRGWEWVRLGTVSELITSGSRDWAKYYSDRGAKFITMSNLSRGSYELRLDTLRYVNPPPGSEGRRTKLLSGDIVISITGDVGNLGLIPEGFGEAYINQHSCLVRPASLIVGRYLPEVLRSPVAQFQFDAPQRGIKNSFRLSDVGLLLVPIPPLNEQKRIVAKVDELMALCDELELQTESQLEAHQQLVETLLGTLTSAQNAEELATHWQRLAENFDLLLSGPMGEWAVDRLKDTILQLAVMGKLVPQDPNDGPASVLLDHIEEEKSRLIAEGNLKKQKPLSAISGDEVPSGLPYGWTYCRLGDLMQVINGRAYKKNEMLDEGTPILRVGNLFTSNDWYYSDLDLEPEKYINNGDLIYAWSASFGPFIWDGGKVIYHYHIWKLKIFDEASLLKEFMYKYLLAVTKSIKASGSGIAMLHMTKQRMENLVIPLPPLPEQHRIVAKVDELMAFCDQLKPKLQVASQTELNLSEVLAQKALGN